MVTLLFLYSMHCFQVPGTCEINLTVGLSLNFLKYRNALFAPFQDNSGIPGQETRKNIITQVLDVQDTPPVFTSSPNAIVVENSPANIRVMQITARDGDTAVSK